MSGRKLTFASSYKGKLRKKLEYIILVGFMAISSVAAYELTTDKKPPVIKDLKWEPMRIVNDKVYDGRVSFVAEDGELAMDIFGFKISLYRSQITNATLEFVPKVYPNLVREAFPNENVRSYRLTPLDGVFDESREEFVVNITDIIGGRKYDIRVTAQNRAGYIDIKNLTTPYIREFEHVISDYLIGASYMTFWGIYWESSPAGRWEDVGTVYEPILGQYDSSNPIAIDKHIDWATGYSIGFFYLDFGWIRPR